MLPYCINLLDVDATTCVDAYVHGLLDREEEHDDSVLLGTMVIGRDV